MARQTALRCFPSARRRWCAMAEERSVSMTPAMACRSHLIGWVTPRASVTTCPSLQHESWPVPGGCSRLASSSTGAVCSPLTSTAGMAPFSRDMESASTSSRHHARSSQVSKLQTTPGRSRCGTGGHSEMNTLVASRYEGIESIAAFMSSIVFVISSNVSPGLACGIDW
eukprot:1284433-Pleurochrysis_carterae.AAC.2